uniref:Uncharacterized protein n=1 Tax=Eutreptiella gymnastica TaxID=73025 RepID=A0A7S4CYQ2_9EUGL|mmetsp:Transcript_6633/g.12541  ORF Transcript_6633/g.12541 Transcript_6633/m.12541 type:complete len:105 (-) Transcript_6633:2463-2777(-)
MPAVQGPFMSACTCFLYGVCSVQLWTQLWGFNISHLKDLWLLCNGCSWALLIILILDCYSPAMLAALSPLFHEFASQTDTQGSLGNIWDPGYGTPAPHGQPGPM